MTSVPLSLIAAMDRNRVIGKGGELPWHLSADLRRFKARTMGKAMLMGRRTFESIGRPLPGRGNLVWTSRALSVPGIVTVRSLEEAIERTAAEPQWPELVVIGGESVYAAALGQASLLDLSLVEVEVEGGDAFFPEFDPTQWRERHRERVEADERNDHSFEIVQLDRVPPLP